MAVTPTISARPVLVKPTCGHSFTGREFFKVTYFHPQVLVPSAGRWLSASIVRCFFIVGVGLPIGRALLVVGLYFYCTTKKRTQCLVTGFSAKFLRVARQSQIFLPSSLTSRHTEAYRNWQFASASGNHHLYYTTKKP